jgi:hypothetical protein
MAAARTRRVAHVYLGYYVEGCRSLEYKGGSGPTKVSCAGLAAGWPSSTDRASARVCVAPGDEPAIGVSNTMPALCLCHDDRRLRAALADSDRCGGRAPLHRVGLCVEHFNRPIQQLFPDSPWWFSPPYTTFTTALVLLGLSAAFGGPWVERRGPRVAATAAALFFGSGCCSAALGWHCDSRCWSSSAWASSAASAAALATSRR